MTQRYSSDLDKSSVYSTLSYSSTTARYPKTLSPTPTSVTSDQRLHLLDTEGTTCAAAKMGENSSGSPNRGDNLIVLDQLVASISDICLVHHPMTILRLQCQANSESQSRHISPLSALHLFTQQFRQHGVVATFTKALQSNCVYITVEGVMKRVIIEGISELTGIDLNISPTLAPTTLKALKFSISSYTLQSAAELLKIVSLVSFYSSNLLIKTQTCLEDEAAKALDHVMIVEFFKYAYYRLVLDCGQYRFTRDAFPFTSLIVPTLLAVGGESLTYYLLQPAVNFAYGLVVYGERGDDRLTPRQKFYRERYVHLITWFIAKTICYKFEVVSTKMHLQGSRTLIDDTDFGDGVVNVNTHFPSFVGCWRATSMMGQNYTGYGFVLLDACVRFGLTYLTSQIGL